MEFWVSVKECVGVCGFPQAESNARKKLEDLVCGRSELRRKRAGTKAFEYHISVLPPEVRAELLATRGLIETSSGLITLPQEPDRVAADDLDLHFRSSKHQTFIQHCAVYDHKQNAIEYLFTCAVKYLKE